MDIVAYAMTGAGGINGPGGTGGINGPGGRKETGTRPKTYAGQANMNVIQSDKMSELPILEITVEKENHSRRRMDHDFASEICDTLGIIKGRDIKGFQLHMNRNTQKLSLWGVQGANIERFLRSETVMLSDG